jgi:hypothetical protein
VAVASKLAIGTRETLRNWVRRAEIDAGVRPGVTSEEAAEIKRLRQENAELHPQAVHCLNPGRLRRLGRRSIRRGGTPGVDRPCPVLEVMAGIDLARDPDLAHGLYNLDIASGSPTVRETCLATVARPTH